MPLIFENPDDNMRPLFARLQAVAVGNLATLRVQIEGYADLYSVSVRAADGSDWHRSGGPDELVAAFENWLKDS